MNYMLTIYGDENAFEALSETEARNVIGAYMAYSSSLGEKNAMIAGEPLEHSKHARRLRERNGKLIIEDGPFTDSKEQIGGFYRVEAKDLDTALDYAAACPGAATGTIEVRPLWDISG